MNERLDKRYRVERYPDAQGHSAVAHTVLDVIKKHEVLRLSESNTLAVAITEELERVFRIPIGRRGGT